MSDLKNRKFPVLDDGFVCLIDYMGTDSDITQAARVSYAEGTKKINNDEGLIRYLLRHRHTTPFEMCELKFLVRVPMDIWRQWIRHRTANVNETSTRYSVAIDSCQKATKWRLQSKFNNQGSDGFVDSFPDDWGSDGGQSRSPQEVLSELERDFHKTARRIYEQRLKFGVAREQARKDLPLSTYTEAYWKIDLHNLLHFLALRMDSHAQEEIREYANAIGKIVEQLYPLTWAAFLDYRVNAVTLSARDLKAFNSLFGLYSGSGIATEIFTILQGITQNTKLHPEWDGKKSRERDEFVAKMKKIIGSI